MPDDIPYADRRFTIEGIGDNVAPANASLSMWLNASGRKAIEALAVGESDHLYFNASGQSTQAKVTRTT